MATWTCCDQASRQIPFTLNGCTGEVSVFYGMNDDPVSAGFDALPGLNLPLDFCRGYPMMQAQITGYVGSGYRMLCGWIQIITRHCLRARGGGVTERSVETSIDLMPTMDSFSLPFASYGYLPQLFDAPCRNLGDNDELTWVADTYLCTVPMRSTDEAICRLLSFRWGYTEYDDAAMKPVALLPLDVTGADAWNGRLSFLEREFVDWTFERAV